MQMGFYYGRLDASGWFVLGDLWRDTFTRVNEGTYGSWRGRVIVLGVRFSAALRRFLADRHKC
jgi:hypothetical protein